MNNKHFIGEAVKSLTGLGTTEPIDGVVLKVDSETAYRSGNQTGYVLEAECPYGTQAMADALLASMQGKSYAGFDAGGVKLPDTAELGDGVTVRGLYGPLVRRRIQFGAELSADIGAPTGCDTDHEFGYTDPIKRQIELAEARSRSYVDRRADEIRIGVEDLEKGVRAELDMKVGKDENGQVVSMLNAAADQINISGNRFVLDSTNFKVSADGKVTATGANITGDVHATSFSLNGVSISEGAEDFTRYTIQPDSAGQKLAEINKGVSSLIIDVLHQMVVKGYLSAGKGSILDLYSELLNADMVRTLELISGPVTTYGPITVNERPNMKGSGTVSAQTFIGKMSQALSFTGGASGRYDGSATLSVKIPVIQHGRVNVTNITPNTNMAIPITFQPPFSDVPAFSVTLESMRPHEVSVGFRDLTASGATIYLYRINDTNTPIQWMAIG